MELLDTILTWFGIGLAVVFFAVWAYTEAHL